MVRTRPTILLVMGILSVVFGSIWTLVWSCSGAMTILAYNIQIPQAVGAGNPARAMNDLLMKEVPGFLPIEITNYLLGLVLSVLMIISGIGLLRMKPWARRTLVIVSIVTILWDSVHSVYQWTYINPLMARWAEETMRKQPPGTPDFTAIFNNPAIKVLMMLSGFVLSVGFPVVLLVILYLPSVRAAFSDRGSNSQDDSRLAEEFEGSS